MNGLAVFLSDLGLICAVVYGSARGQLNNLSDEVFTKINIEYYGEPTNAVFKVLVE